MYQTGRGGTAYLTDMMDADEFMVLRTYRWVSCLKYAPALHITTPAPATSIKYAHAYSCLGLSLLTQIVSHLPGSSFFLWPLCWSDLRLRGNSDPVLSVPTHATMGRSQRDAHKEREREGKRERQRERQKEK